LLIGLLAGLTAAGPIVFVLAAWSFWVLVLVVIPVSLLLAAQARAGILQALAFALGLAVGLWPAAVKYAEHFREALFLFGFGFLAGLCLAPVYLLTIFAVRQERARWKSRHSGRPAA
jgi:hypothetical protein